MRKNILLSIAVALIALPGGAVLGSSTPASADDGDAGAGHLYVLDNNLGATNSITVFERAADGSLARGRTTKIGGTGSLAAFANGTQGSLILTGGGSRLFAVDAGSDQISVVDVDDGHLRLAGVFPSGGTGPVSVTYRGDRLYVLNAANASTAAANVAGFRVGEGGRLHPIPGATRPLSAAHPNPAQVQIDPSGQFVVVTEKDTSLIDVYRIGRDGSLSGPTTVPSVGAVPFGMAFRPTGVRHELIVADAAGGPDPTGAVTAYNLAGGNLQLVNGPVANGQLAPCWMVITRNGRFAYTSNAASRSISGYRIDADGRISLLNADGVTGASPSDTFPLEEALSRNSRFLYVLDSRILLTPPGPVTLSGFRVHNDGSLSHVVDESQIALAFTTIGLAAD